MIRKTRPDKGSHFFPSRSGFWVCERAKVMETAAVLFLMWETKTRTCATKKRTFK